MTETDKERCEICFGKGRYVAGMDTVALPHEAEGMDYHCMDCNGDGYFCRRCNTPTPSVCECHVGE